MAIYLFVYLNMGSDSMGMSSAWIRQNITDRILVSLEKGVKPWARPWSLDPNMGHPTSFATKKKYQGVNPLLLDITASEKGYSGKFWGTFNQWKGLGACVKPGEKATWIIYFNVNEKKREVDGVEEIDKYAILRMFAVFCIDQVHGESVDRFRPDKDVSDSGLITYTLADETISATGATIGHGGNSAFFRPNTKEIKVPYKKKFDSEECYYSTVFHELSHWADHAIGSKMGKRFGDEDYFFGELVAEMSACYLCEACGIPAGKRWGDSMDYLGGWIERMKKDSSWIMKAATRASSASEYILNFSRKEELAEV